MDKEKFDNRILETAIIKVIAFFDLFEYPLTALEIRGNLSAAPDWGELLAVLDKLIGRVPFSSTVAAESPRLEAREGFYFLPGRAETIVTRQKRYNYTRRKLAIARRFTFLFGLFPFVRVVALANFVGSHNLRDGSDIDFFIITSARRLWLSRLYCAGLAKLLNRRPTSRTKRDRLCLSFYISTDHLDIEDLRLSGADPYFDYWRRGLVVLYNKDKTYEKFLAANRLTSDGMSVDAQSLPVGETLSAVAPAWPGRFGDWLEKAAKAWQLQILPDALRTAMNNSDGVVVSDAILKLYYRDRRREFLEKYGNKLHEIIPTGD